MKYHPVAVDEVERMLQHSSDLVLVNLPAMQADSTELSQRLGTQIAGTVSLHLNRVQAGLREVTASAEGVAATRLAFEVIDELCQDCAALIEHHAKIQLLGMTQSNLFKTLFDAENIAELPHDAMEAEKLLSTNEHLFKVG